ncbi:MAG: Hsp20/alpha crystallin family protein [Nannocystaceae bacterium]|nr:Hsp20/alpha crystallin family protein [bacterium]
MDDVFRDADRPLLGLGAGNQAWPQLDLRDEGDELVLRADVPGLTDKDISIDATAQGFTIRGEKKVGVPEGYTTHRQERGSMRFARSISLPSKVDLEAVRASVKDGVLTIRAAKQAEERPKQITVKAS